MLATLPDAQPANADCPPSRLIPSAQPANKAARRNGRQAAAVVARAGEIEDSS